MNDLYPGIDCGGKAVDSGLLGDVYVASIDDATVHQDAVDASDAYNVFTLFVTLCCPIKCRVEMSLKSQYGVRFLKL